MRLFTNSLKLLVLLSLAAVAARADTTAECYSFYANPSTYYGPPGVITADGNPLFYSFIVTTTYVNNCAEPRYLGVDSGVAPTSCFTALIGG